MAIPQHTIDQILDRTDIVDVIGQFVKLKKTGRTYSGCCPFHQEKSPSFHVYRDKQYFHCFGCQANGNAIRFLMDIGSRNFVEVMKDLSSQTGIELPKDNTDSNKLKYKREAAKPKIAPAQAAPQAQPQQNNAPTENNSAASTASFDPFAEFQAVEQDFYGDPFASFEHLPMAEVQQDGNLYDLLENIAQFYERQLPNSPSAQQYFKQRGLTTETIAYWRLGYAPEDWQHLEKAFPQDIEGLKLLGLIRTSDSGRDFDLLRERVIFPIRDTKGRVVGFGGRALNDEIKPKYINSPDSEVFHKNQLLYGLYEGRKQKAQEWLMVEGYMDVIALQQYGIHGAVATLGTASNTDHLNILFKQSNRLTIAFDGDAAGQKAARRTLDIALPLLNDGRELKFFVLPADHDPDSLIRREGIENFRRLLEQAPLMSDFVFAHLTQNQDITTPEGKSQVMGELKNLTELLPKHGSFRYLLQQFFREKLGFNRKWQPKVNTDASLSFSTKIDAEEYVIAILMNHPYLYIHFEPLRALVAEDQLLFKILNILNVIFDDLPDDPELSIYYVLGACAAHHHELQHILQHANVSDYTSSPEQADKLAADFSTKLQYQCLKNKIKSKKFSSIAEMKNLKMQIYEIDRKRSMTLLED
ncbi:DNA primase [Acinetobacter sp. CIP 101966]|jgi:DNA primase|uniref:DNA primase n=1 Tax=Acinetobacter lwoffii TaxID=28090 RepID=A0A6N1MQ66_ACILW|nr:MULTISPECIES: CHC2 zinc finger domain-containing protein [Acinetobacter]EEY89490.1 DNA primase [Acinetobacter lwoffii SH145]ENU62020.1 DNA primase [Acinetobacter lwoffii NIPH 715]ENX26713.1 DNA primase [Acinetobacter sp. CIP 101966]MDP1316656.1 CHC2 zinc finger domain-containing protein [Acinetobacter lwoffii]QKU20941.1 DNA primase [Acinetobacter lwoffii]